MSKPRGPSQLLHWYHGEKPVFEALARSASNILQNLLNKANVPLVSVSTRVKTSESLLGKLKRKRYKNPATEITDFVGLRVITYTEDDVRKVCEIIKSSFEVDLSKSVDKSEELEVDQIGYRSFHFICTLGKQRVTLPEFELFAGRLFEVQIRTVLQHAWAEVEHDRNYKFAGGLPTQLKRRLYLISGLLEVGDRELNQLSRDIDQYTASINAKEASDGSLADEELSSITLIAKYPELTKPLKNVRVRIDVGGELLATVVEECRLFGLHSVKDLNSIFTADFLAAIDKTSSNESFVGLTRDAMMFADLDRYFDKCWRHSWTGVDSPCIKLLAQKYGEEEVRAKLRSFDIEVINDDVYWSFADEDEA